MARPDHAFTPAHDWQHIVAPSRFPIGKTVTATCPCGAELAAVCERADGRVSRVELSGCGSTLACKHTGRDKRDDGVTIRRIP